MPDTDAVKDRLDRFDARFRELAIRENEAFFAMYRGLEHEDLNKIEAEISAMWREPETLELAEIEAPDPALVRPLFLIRQGVLRAKVEGREEIYTAKNEANQLVVDFTPELDGEPISRSDLGEVGRWERDAGRRRRAAAAYVPLEEQVHEKVLDLINKRNAAARELGYLSYPHLSFELDELNLEEVQVQLNALLAKGTDGFRAVLDEHKDRPEMTKDGLLTSDLPFLHENYLPNLPRESFPADTLLDALKDGYKSIGIDLDSLPIRTIIQDIPAGGFCFTFDPGKDMRILANPRDGQTWYQVLFHEFGHAVQGSVAKGDGHYLVALGDPGFFWESIAVLFEKACLRKEFLTRFVDDSDAISRFGDGVRKRLAYRVRSLSVEAVFEHSLYLDPAPYDVLQKRRESMIRGYYFVDPAVDPPPFTHSVFHITHPCYIHNYVLAELVAAQLLTASDNPDDPWTPDFAKRVLDELLVPGAMINWKEKVERFTGAALSPDALVGWLYS